MQQQMPPHCFLLLLLRLLQLLLLLLLQRGPPGEGQRQPGGWINTSPSDERLPLQRTKSFSLMRRRVNYLLFLGVYTPESRRVLGAPGGGGRALAEQLDAVGGPPSLPEKHIAYKTEIVCKST